MKNCGERYNEVIGRSLQCFLLLIVFGETMKISGEAYLLSFAYSFW